MPDTLNWGPNDTLLTSAICYDGNLIPYKESEMAWVSNMTEKQLEKYKREYNRLRNAVYVTYPFARTAGVTLNERSVCRSANQFICIPGQGFDETDQPPDR